MSKKKKAVKSSVNDLLSAIRKRTESTSFTESDFLHIPGYIDTGSYAINRVLTGDIYKGVPEGRITTFYGGSASGKSFVAANIIKNALTKHDYDIIFYIDSEGGGLNAFLEKEGVDLDKIEHILVSSIEECSTKLLFIYDQLEKAIKSEKSCKALVVLDSFGALVAEKLLSDAIDKDKQVQDMGLTAKLKNSMMKSLMTRVMKTKAPLIVLNHVYDNPGALHPTKIKDMPGGKGLEFSSHIIVQTSKKLEKEDTSNNENYFKGNTMKFFTVKNRIVKPGYSAECFVNFNTGINKWEGLIEDAKRMGFITGGASGRYYIPSYSEKMLRMKDLLENDEAWLTFLEDFNKRSIEEVSYGSKINENTIQNDMDIGLEN